MKMNVPHFSSNSTAVVPTYYADAKSSFSVDNSSDHNNTTTDWVANHDVETGRLIHVVCRPILIVCGTIGNLLTFYIMRRGSLKNVSTCFYMAILALADTGMLWGGAFTGWINYLTHGRLNLDVWTKCKPGFFIYFFCGSYSSALLIIMSVEKFLALYFPLKTKSICTVTTAKKVSGVTAVLYAVYCGQAFILYNSKVNTMGLQECVFDSVSETYKSFFYSMSSVLYSFLPFVFMIITNCAIIYKLLVAKWRSKYGESRSTNQALSKSATKGTAMLITVSIMFIVLTGPIAFAYSITDDPSPVVESTVVVLAYLNHSINGALYCIAGSKFRKELAKLLGFCGKNKVNSETQTGQNGSTNVTAMDVGQSDA